MFINHITLHRSRALGASDDENIPTALPWDANAAIAAPGISREPAACRHAPCTAVRSTGADSAR